MRPALEPFDFLGDAEEWSPVVVGPDVAPQAHLADVYERSGLDEVFKFMQTDAPLVCGIRSKRLEFQVSDRRCVGWKFKLLRQFVGSPCDGGIRYAVEFSPELSVNGAGNHPSRRGAVVAEDCPASQRIAVFWTPSIPKPSNKFATGWEEWKSVPVAHSATVAPALATMSRRLDEAVETSPNISSSIAPICQVQVMPPGFVAEA